MKFAAILFCLVATASPIFGGLVTGKIEDEIEAIRDQMPYGFPGLGIPPLAPLDVKKKDFDVSFKNVNAQGDIENLLVSGLNEFQIKKCKFSIFNKKFDIKLVFPLITVNTDYFLDSSVTRNKVHTTVSGSGSGDIKMQKLELNVSGKVKYSLFSGRVELKKLDVVVKPGKIVSEVDGLLVNGKVNEKLNNALENEMDNIINANQKRITNFFATVGLEKINAFLEDKNILSLASKDSAILEALAQISVE